MSIFILCVPDVTCSKLYVLTGAHEKRRVPGLNIHVSTISSQPFGLAQTLSMLYINSLKLIWNFKLRTPLNLQYSQTYRTYTCIQSSNHGIKYTVTKLNIVNNTKQVC